MANQLYLGEWLAMLLESTTEDTNMYEVRMLNMEARSAVWGMCLSLGVETRGVPGLTCKLLEYYLASYMYNRANGTENGGGYEYAHWVSRMIPLSMASCIQLAAKMNSTEYTICPNTIRTCLLCRGLSFTVDEIRRSEFHVYQMLGFRIPMWTSVDIAEALAAFVRLPEDVVQAAALFVNVAEYNRPRIDRLMRWSARHPSCSGRPHTFESRCLYMLGAAVLAGATFMSHTPDPAPSLAHLLRVPIPYLRCISESIISLISTNEVSNNLLHKKPHRELCRLNNIMWNLFR